MKLSQQTTRITRISLIAICVLCSGFIAYEWVRPYRLSVDPPRLLPDDSIPAAPEIPANRPAVSLETFSDITERPLFRQDRRPYVAEAPAEPKQPRDTGSDITAQITLSGVVIDDDERIALIERKQDKKLQQLRQGDTFNGWTLDQIRPDDITMQKGQESRQIALTVKLSRQQAQPHQDGKPADTEKQSRMASPANTPESRDAQN